MCADNRNGECPMHGPLHSLRRLVGTSSAAAAAPPPELPEWLRDLPREVCLCTSTVPGLAYGICAAQRIQQGTWIGPFQGVLLAPEKVQAGTLRNTQHLWEVSQLSFQALCTCGRCEGEPALLPRVSQKVELCARFRGPPPAASLKYSALLQYWPPGAHLVVPLLGS